MSSEASRPDVGRCPRCGAPIAAGATRCPNGHLVRQSRVAMAREQASPALGQLPTGGLDQLMPSWLRDEARAEGEESSGGIAGSEVSNWDVKELVREEDLPRWLRQMGRPVAAGEDSERATARERDASEAPQAAVEAGAGEAETAAVRSGAVEQRDGGESVPAGRVALQNRGAPLGKSLSVPSVSVAPPEGDRSWRAMAQLIAVLAVLVALVVVAWWYFT